MKLYSWFCWIQLMMIEQRPWSKIDYLITRSWVIAYLREEDSFSFRRILSRISISGTKNSIADERISKREIKKEEGFAGYGGGNGRNGVVRSEKDGPRFRDPPLLSFSRFLYPLFAIIMISCYGGRHSSGEFQSLRNPTTLPFFPENSLFSVDRLVNRCSSLFYIERRKVQG